MAKKKKIPKKLTKEIEETRKAITNKTITLILGGIGLVAALAWNEAIKSIFETVLKPAGELAGKVIYAIIITLILAVVSRYLQKILMKKKQG